MTDASYKLIKRYPNRKLYDTESSTYVTLDDIAKMVKAGRDLKIIDHKSGNDITNVTLAQIVFEEGKRKRGALPITTLKELITQRGEQVRDFVDRIVHESPLSHAREEAEEKVQLLLRRGESARDESTRFFKELVGNYTKAVEDVQKKLDDRVRDFSDRLAGFPAVIGDLGLLNDRLSAIEKRLEELDGRLQKIETARQEK